MDQKQITALLTLQASIHQMLIISKDRLPNDEELAHSIMDSVQFVEHDRDITIDKDTFVTLCHLAVNVRETIDNPEQYIIKMIEKMF